MLTSLMATRIGSVPTYTRNEVSSAAAGVGRLRKGPASAARRLQGAAAAAAQVGIADGMLMRFFEAAILLAARRDLGVNRRSAANWRSVGDRHCVLLDGYRINMCGPHTDMLRFSMKLDTARCRCLRGDMDTVLSTILTPILRARLSCTSKWHIIASSSKKRMEGRNSRLPWRSFKRMIHQ